MRKIPREKIALLIFGAMIMVIVVGTGFYLVAGHNWNYAATHIDDAAGEMDGYEMLVYEGLGIPKDTRVGTDGALEFKPYPVRTALHDYAEKGALVHLIDLGQRSRYDEPAILCKGKRRIGVMNVKDGDTPYDIQERIDYLNKRAVDLVLAIVDEQALISQVDGVDVYLDLGQNSPLKTGSSSADGYRVALPDTGTVGAIVISPNDVLSARVLEP